MSFSDAIPKVVIALLAFAVLIILGLSLEDVSMTIQKLGRNLPNEASLSGYLMGWVWAFGFAVAIGVSPINHTDKIALLTLWAARTFVTLIGMLVYEYQYVLDSYSYYSAALEPYFDMNLLIAGSGTVVVSWLCWAMNQYLPIFDSFHAIKVIFSFFGLAGCFIFYRAFCIYLATPKIKLLYFLGAFPSIIFWSSILGKDPITFLGISIYTYGVMGLLQRGKMAYFALIIFGILLTTVIRPWMGIILIAPLPLSMIISSTLKVSRKIYVGVLAFGAIGYFINTFLKTFRIESSDSLISVSAHISSSWSHGGSSQQVETFTSFWGMVKFAPKGMIAALLRPFPFEVHSLFGLIAGFENLFTIILFFLAMRSFKWELLKEPAINWATSLVLIWSFVYGFASYQNLGTASRYRLQVFPIFMALLLYINFIYRPIQAKAKGANLKPVTKL